jgi:hypothetical protein
MAQTTLHHPLALAGMGRLRQPMPDARNMTDISLIQPATLPRSETRSDRITPKVRAAIEQMVWNGLPFDQAAQVAGMHVAAMRKALNRPHVMALLKSEMQVLRSSEHPRSIHRLAQIRDAANNMPAVVAAKHLLETEQTNSNSSSNTSPGVTIRILNQTAVVAAPADEE